MIPTGIGVKTAWKNVCEGRSGIGPLTRFDTNGFETKIAGEVKGFNPERYIEKKEIKKMDLFIQYAMGAAQEAMEDSGLQITPENADRIGVIVGTGLGGLPTLEKYHQILLEKGPSRISPFFIPMLIANLASGQIAIRFGAKGPNTCIVTACATGAHCIGECVPRDPVRGCRCHYRRRNRGQHYASDHRWIQCHEGPFRPETMSRREPPSL